MIHLVSIRHPVQAEAFQKGLPIGTAALDLGQTRTLISISKKIFRITYGISGLGIGICH